MPVDEELEKLFEGMSREAVREVSKQNSLSKRAKTKKVVCVEPAEYIPEHICRELKLVEFTEPKTKSK